MNCDCQHEGVCKHRLNIGVALDPILVKYFGGFEVNKDVWDFISNKCRFKQSKAAPVQQITGASTTIKCDEEGCNRSASVHLCDEHFEAQTCL